jgi:AbrB family looped-hinge helix DNA binding protein
MNYAALFKRTLPSRNRRERVTPQHSSTGAATKSQTPLQVAYLFFGVPLLMQKSKEGGNMAEAKLSRKNQIVIPLEARKALGLKPGDTLLIVPRGTP